MDFSLNFTQEELKMIVDGLDSLYIHSDDENSKSKILAEKLRTFLNLKIYMIKSEN